MPKLTRDNFGTAEVGSQQALLKLPSRQEAIVIVTIELPHKPFFVRVWRGSSVKAIRTRAREKYGKEAVLHFGPPLWQNFYGAH
jgi:hypothetical protein